MDESVPTVPWRTVTGWKQGQNTLDFPVTWGRALERAVSSDYFE